MIWSEEQLNDLRRLWDFGSSAAIIAAELGCTRNAVLGKVHRLGLSSRRTIVVKAPIGKRRPDPASYPRFPRVPRARSIIAFDVTTSHDAKEKLRKINFAHYVEPTKNELRAMLAQAVRNTAAMQ